MYMSLDWIIGAWQGANQKFTKIDAMPPKGRTARHGRHAPYTDTPRALQARAFRASSDHEAVVERTEPTCCTAFKRRPPTSSGVGGRARRRQPQVRNGAHGRP